jgi:hypothetical protein
LDAIGYRAFIAEEQPQLRTGRKRVGIGVVFYVKGTGIGPYEGARIQVQGSGRVRSQPVSATLVVVRPTRLKRRSAADLVADLTLQELAVG